ncbi:MAG: peptide ABC transporter ATP-binding protein [SAR116 cluster bacterium]|nr:peptide ABC transporter ATP-binding protein [SAR116 cluster bacterium]|tara:strand:+ start:1017 stop:2039 length:1023 start_codon:yes stop_codon:yes gene_type:complete
MAKTRTDAPLLDVRNLSVQFTTRAGTVTVLDDISFTLERGERISFVGESGCGKSMTALALMGLLPAMGRVSGGQILFKGEDLTQASAARLRRLRGNEVSMIFQEPMTSLNPVFTIGQQIVEVLRLHRGIDNASARRRALELLEAVRIPNASARIDDYPHQLSGGQRQRVMIAIALACEPEILIADEPTTALDVTVQAEIFALLRDLGTKLDTAIILITHDMGAVAQMSERMLVMYAGRRVEEGRVADVVGAPAHPYTRGLIACVPHITSNVAAITEQLPEIDGIVPPITRFGRDECLFAPRCIRVADGCLAAKPQQVEMAGHDAHSVACWHPFASEGAKG